MDAIEDEVRRLCKNRFKAGVAVTDLKGAFVAIRAECIARVDQGLRRAAIDLTGIDLPSNPSPPIAAKSLAKSTSDDELAKVHESRRLSLERFREKKRKRIAKTTGHDRSNKAPAPKRPALQDAGKGAGKAKQQVTIGMHHPLKKPAFQNRMQMLRVPKRPQLGLGCCACRGACNGCGKCGEEARQLTCSCV